MWGKHNDKGDRCSPDVDSALMRESGAQRPRLLELTQLIVCQDYQYKMIYSCVRLISGHTK